MGGVDICGGKVVYTLSSGIDLQFSQKVPSKVKNIYFTYCFEPDLVFNLSRNNLIGYGFGRQLTRLSSLILELESKQLQYSRLELTGLKTLSTLLINEGVDSLNLVSNLIGRKVNHYVNKYENDLIHLGFSFN